MPTLKKAILFSLAVGLVGVLAALAPHMSALEENLGLHLLFQLRGPCPAPSDVVVVALDRQSSKAMNLPMEPRKWPRTVHARLIDRLTELGAKVIVFDLIFNETQSAETDLALAHAMGRAGNVILAQSMVDETVPVVDTQGILTAQVNIEKIVPPIPLLSQAALGQAPFPVPKMPVKLSRIWTFKPNAGDAPTLPVLVFHAYAWEAFVQLTELLNDAAPNQQAESTLPLQKTLPVGDWLGSIQKAHGLFQRGAAPKALMDKNPRRYPEPMATWMQSMIRLYSERSIRYVNFYGPAESLRTIAYYKLMEASDGGLAHFDLRGKAVFVGQTDSYWPRAKDGFYTVYARDDAVDISGVEIAATAFANLIENRSIDPLNPAAQLGIIFIWGALMAMVGSRLPAVLSVAGTLGLAALYLIFACLRFNAVGAWYPIVVPLLLLTPLAYFSGLMWKYRIVNHERRTIRKAFGYYLPDPVVDQLARNIQSIQTQRQALYSICLYTDAEKYTTLSETMDPESLTVLMNQYYEAIFKPIRDNGGVVLQVVGDSVLSLWTAARPDPTLNQKACAAALGVTEAVERFNTRADAHRLPTRIGLHSGEVVLGNIGALDHFEYRPVGDIVNTASRLEGLNKYLQTRILASKTTIDSVNGFATRYVGTFVFVGKSKPVEVHEVMARSALADQEYPATMGYFAQGLDAFGQRGWDQARTAFKRVIAAKGPDGPSNFYLGLCEQYQHTPPDADWDGTIHPQQK